MIKKAKWAVKEAHLRLKYMRTKDCIFCKITKGEIKSEIIFENENVIALNDINPVAKVHILIIPKKHVASVTTVEKQDGEVLVSMFVAATDITNKRNLDAYRLSFNGGKFQHVPHLHMHLLAGSKIEWSKL